MWLQYKIYLSTLLIIDSAHQRCAGSGVQESSPAGVGVFQPEPEWFLFLVFLRY